MILRIRWLWLTLLVANSLLDSPLLAQQAKEQKSELRVTRDIEYANREGVSLQLDLYLPSDHGTPVPCVVFVHGGGWAGGSKKSAEKNAAWLTQHGFAIASIDYRLTDVAQWPAQIDDCYQAVRWVRENAGTYGIDPLLVGAWGTSAGGHLVALMGTRACPNSETVSSRVQAVCDWFGPSELLTMPPNNIGNGRTEADIAKSNGATLLGATVRDVPKLARDASGVDHVSPDDAAFLIMHGDQDPGVPIEQSTKLHAKLIRSGVPSQLHVVVGGKHGGPEFQTEQSRAVVLRFFQRTLKQNWNQGVGPDGGFRIRDASAPTTWSAVRNENIHWRKTLPETGQSTVVTWHKDAPLADWTQLQALELATGRDVWSTSCGVNMGCVPLLQTRSDGRRVMVVGRGGGHSPPEKPDGVSMIDTDDGHTLWTLPLENFMSTMTFNLYGDDVLVFHAGDHLWVDHHASQVPTVIGEHLYVPTMAGTVYVVRWEAERLDESAIVAINDLGPVGESWNRASLSFSRGKLYAHTIRELICIGNN